MKQLLLITTFLAFMAGAAIAQPAVNGTTPSRNSVNIASDANINIGFNQTMDAATLNASSILVFGSYRGKYTGAISYSGTTAVFNPDDDYLPGEVITVVVTTGAESSGNTPMARSYSFSFTTEADGDGLFKPEDSFSAVPGSQADDVVTADLNGNGLVDIAVLSQGSNSISVHFNNGDETFASPVVLSTANIPMKLIAADLDGDGVQDLAAANYSASSLSVFMNNGDDTFATRVDYSTPSSLAASDLVAVDLTGNGNLDIVQLQIDSNPAQYLFIYPGNGDGTFGTATQYGITALNGGGNLAAGDYNRDWRPDIVLADNDANTIRLYENDGSGTGFLTGGSYPVGTDPAGLTLVNLDGDGYIDAVTANSDSDNITTRRQNSGFAFFDQGNFAAGNFPNAVSGGDLDADGDIDLVVGNNVGGTISYMRNRLSDSFPSSFFPNVEYNISGNPNTVKLADLNNDGKLDIISANTNGTVSILYNYPGPEVMSITPVNGSTEVSSTEDIVISFNEDMDESTLNSTNITVSGSVHGSYTSTYSYNSGDNSLTIDPSSGFVTGESITVTVTTNVTNSIGTPIVAGAISTFDIEDLAVQSISPARNTSNVSTGSNIDITFNDSMDEATLTSSNVLVAGSVSGTISGVYSFNAGSNTLSVDPANDLIPGEKITVHVTTNVTNSGGIALNSDYQYSFTVGATGGEILQSPANVDFISNIRDLKFVDFDNDGDTDIVTAESNGALGGLGVYLNDGSGGYTFSDTTNSANNYVNKIAIADFDQDGYMDAVGSVYGQEGYLIRVFINDQAGSFNAPVAYTYSTNYAQGVEAADINLDGYPDIVATRSNADAVHVLQNDGDGTFTAQSAVTVGDGPYLSIQLIDVDSDNDLDIVTADWDGNTISVAKNNGDGTFAAHSSYSMTGSGVYTGFFDSGDIDGDGDLDLVASQTDEDDEPVEGITVFFNDGSGNYSSTSSISATAGDLELMDIEGDGDLDIVLANGGTLTTLINNGSGSFTTSPYSSNAGGTYIYGIDASDIDGDGDLDLAAGSYSALHIFKNGELVTVSSTSPASNALDVGASTPITVTFNTNMDGATLDSTSIRVESSVRGKLSGTYSYNSGTQTVTFTPTDSYLAGEVISVNITKGAESSGGASLISGKFFSFTAEADGYGYFNSQIGNALSSALTKTVGADMTGDGVADLIAASYSDIKVYENDGSGGLTELSSLSISSLNNVWVHDLNQDGFPDVIAKRDSDNNIYFFINDGTGDFEETDYTLVDNFYISIYNGTAAIAFADINGDGIEDLTFTSPNFSNTRFVLGEGNLAYGNTTFVGSDGGYALEIADINNDGIPDLVWAGNGDTAGTVHIAVGQGGGSFGSVTTRDVGERPEALVVADLTGNGYPDIATADVNGQSYSVIINSGGSFGQAAIYNTSGFEPEAIFSSDVDGDGDLDLLVSGALETYIAEYDYTTELPKVLVAYNDGNGGFGNQIYFGNDYEDPNYYEGPQSISVLDLAGDGRLDIAGYARGMDESFNTLHNFAFLNNSAAGSSSAPTVAASNPSSSDISSSSATVSWTNGDGLRRLVIVKEGNAVDATLTDDAGYNANPAFGSGTEIGTGNYVVYGGTGNSVTISGLNSETEYHYAIYEINGIPGQEKVLTTGAPTGSFTTAPPPEVWTIADGTITVTKDDYADWNLEQNQDRVAYDVWFTRKDDEGLFNIAQETGWSGSVSPKGTLWALGTTDDIGSLSFDTFRNTLDGSIGDNIVDADMVVYLQDHDVYFDIKFSSWTSNGNGGGFSYTRAAGTVAPPPPPTFDAEAGFALQFDGTDDYFYYDLEDPETEEYAPMPDPVTFEMWVKPGTFTDDKMVIGSSYGTQYRFGIDSTQAFYATFREGAVGAWKRATGTTVLNDNQWYHLAISANSGGEIKVYVNGMLEGSTSTSEVNTSIDRFHFGGMRFPDNGEYHRFNGQLDEVRIWKTERTESEIRSTMFTTASGGGYSNMFATWQMNEGTGNSVVDLVNGNNLDLTLGGASTQPDWVTSDAPLGQGTVEESTDFQTGTATIGNAALSMADGFDNPVDVQVTEVTGSPNQFPSGFTSGIGGKYFVINLFGDPGTFSADLTLTYGAGVITATQESNPSLLKLYKRSSSSTGAWTEIASATSASSATGVVTWTGITSFSQFIAVAEEYVPPTLDIQIANGSDVVSYTDSTYTFTSSFFDLAGGYADSALTISAKSTPSGNLYLDQDENGVYDSGTDNQLTANVEFPYTPSGSIKLRYEGSFAGLDTVTIKLQKSAEVDSVQLDFLTVEGAPTLQGNADENGWYLLSNPVDSTIGMLLSNVWTQGAINSDAPSGDVTLYRFIQDSAQYVAITTDLDTTKLGAGEGLLAYIFEDDDVTDGQDDIDGGWPKTLANYGNPFGTDVNIAVKNVDFDGVSGTTGSEGFALLGNPYGWPLSADSVIASLKREDELANSYVYRWDPVNKTYKILSGGTIEAYESVFVRVVGSGTTADLSFDYNDAITGPSKKAQEEKLEFNLAHTESGLVTTSSVRFDEKGDAGIDPYDGYYLGSYATEFANLYSVIKDQPLTINNLPKGLAEVIEVPVYLDASISGEFQLIWDSEQIPQGWTFELEELKTGTKVNLADQQSYVFNANNIRKQSSHRNPASLYTFDGHGNSSKSKSDVTKEPLFVLTVTSNMAVSNEGDMGIPTEVELYQNYPNPFNPTSVIRFGVPEASKVKLEVFDVLGRKVATLLNNETKSTGRYNVQFNARTLSSGMYIYRLQVGDKVLIKKMTLIK